MDGNSMSMLLYRRFIPQGKVRRRVQDLRFPSASYFDFIASHRLDLSHNESTRMAVDSLLNQGLEGYHQVLSAEGEVDFLSQPEKTYIMENCRNGSAAGPSTSDDQSESSFSDPQFGTRCPTLSTDDDPSVGADLSCQRGVTDCVSMKPSVEVYFQSHCRAASMKDLIREFMRKATESLVIVMDSFSDVELLCDLLEASRKRNVSVHLLLDHLNLSLFVSMWQELKLDSKNFPKLCVRSVQGETYCAKTGRKLTGQICESFIFTDWTEVLTGSYSFSWLSWQVHRCLAVLLKGSAVLPFQKEFLRLNSSSQAVPGFVSYIAVPAAPAFSDDTTHAPQKGEMFASERKLSRIEDKKAEANAKVQFFTSLESNRDKGVAQPAGSGAQARPKPLQNVSACTFQPAGGAADINHDSQRNGESPKDSRNQLSPLSPTRVSHVQSQFSGLTVSATAQKTFPMQRRCTTVQYQTPSSNLDYSSVGAHGLFGLHQNEKDRSVKTLGTAAHQKNKHRWFHTQTFRAKTDFLSLPPNIPPRSTLRLLSPLTHPRGHKCGLQGEGHQPRLQSQPTPQPSAASVPAPHLKPQLQAGSKFLSLGAQLNQESPLRLNWKSQSSAAKPKLAPRHSFLSSLYRPGWRPFHSSCSASLRRSKSLTQPSSFPKTVLLSDVAET